VVTASARGCPSRATRSSDGYDNLVYWTGRTDKSAGREYFYYDETDLMALRVDAVRCCRLVA